MSDQFGGTPLIMTSVRGYRGWDVERWGTLQPVTQKYPETYWRPGENHATCVMHGILPGHVVAAPHCQCGFYAYYSARGMAWGIGRSAPVKGVIEGYGSVTLGSKGFRCSRARIVAVCYPRRSFTQYLPNAMSLSFSVASVAFAIESGHAWAIAVTSVMFGMLLTLAWAFERARRDHNRIMGHDSRRQVLQAMREQYPAVRFYRSDAWMRVRELWRYRRDTMELLGDD